MVAALVVYFVPPDVWTRRAGCTGQFGDGRAHFATGCAGFCCGCAGSGFGPGGLCQRCRRMTDLAASAPAEAAAALPPAVAAAAIWWPSATRHCWRAAGLVQLRSSEASWVDVRDARGSVLLSRTVQPGEAWASTAACRSG
jgi:hypothetical protein